MSKERRLKHKYGGAIPRWGDPSGTGWTLGGKATAVLVNTAWPVMSNRPGSESWPLCFPANWILCHLIHMSLLSPYTKCPVRPNWQEGWRPRKVRYMKLSPLLALLPYNVLSLSLFIPMYHLIKCSIPGTHGPGGLVILALSALKAALYWTPTVLTVSVPRAITAPAPVLLANSRTKHYLTPSPFCRGESWGLERWSHFPKLPHPNGSPRTCTKVWLAAKPAWYPLCSGLLQVEQPRDLLIHFSEEIWGRVWTGKNSFTISVHWRTTHKILF